MTVLLVDDSQAIRRLLVFALRDLGATEIIEADSAEMALRILKFCGSINLIISDWHMPGMSGLEFVRILRNDPKYQALPIIMSTSEANGANVVAALRTGITNYVIKPFNKKQFSEKVGPYIQRNGVNGASGGSRCMPSVSQSGLLAGDDLADLLQFFIQSRKTGVCQLRNAGQMASVFFVEGRIGGAVFEALSADDAFYACFHAGFTGYSMREGPGEIPPACRIETNNQTLLLTALKNMDEQRCNRPPSPRGS